MKDKKINRSVVLQHYEEALDALVELVSDLKFDDGFIESDLEAALVHVYHHLNTGWNMRKLSDAEVKDTYNEEGYNLFFMHRMFPKDINMGP